MSKFRVVLTDHGRGEVYRDGERLTHVQGIKIEAGVDSATVVTVTFVGVEVDADLAEAEEAISHG